MCKRKVVYKYSIGDPVICIGIAKIHKSWRERFLVPEKLESAFNGIVVGYRRRYEGTVHMGSIDEDGAEPNYFEVTKVHTVVLIRRGLFNKPVECFEAQVYPMRSAENCPLVLPTIYAKQLPWTKEERLSLAEDIKDAPRDKRGRFIKCK